VIHIGATDSISRYDLTQAVTRRMGYDEQLIKPQAMPEAIPGRAPRHKNGIISVARAQHILKTRLLSTEESIQRAFNDANPRFVRDGNPRFVWDANPRFVGKDFKSTAQNKSARRTPDD
jgi:hypothetical protein